VRDLMDVEELLYCWKNLKSYCIAGKTWSVPSSLIWSVDSMESYARTCSLPMTTTLT
jgi:hypothetical protein